MNLRWGHDTQHHGESARALLSHVHNTDITIYTYNNYYICTSFPRKTYIMDANIRALYNGAGAIMADSIR
jgi:hypothetical protein